jgi:hypothetical protein
LAACGARAAADDVCNWLHDGQPLVVTAGRHTSDICRISRGDKALQKTPVSSRSKINPQYTKSWRTRRQVMDDIDDAQNFEALYVGKANALRWRVRDQLKNLPLHFGNETGSHDNVSPPRETVGGLFIWEWRAIRARGI